MRKLSLRIGAIVVALSLLGFTRSKSTQLSLYWFKYIALTGQYEFDTYGLTPTVFCMGFKYPCAQGYYNEPEQDGEGEYIYPSTTPNCELRDGFF